jgi:hypothetical protein
MINKLAGCGYPVNKMRSICVIGQTLSYKDQNMGSRLKNKGWGGRSLIFLTARYKFFQIATRLTIL